MCMCVGGRFYLKCTNRGACGLNKLGCCLHRQASFACACVLEVFYKLQSCSSVQKDVTARYMFAQLLCYIVMINILLRKGNAGAFKKHSIHQGSGRSEVNRATKSCMEGSQAKQCNVNRCNRCATQTQCKTSCQTILPAIVRHEEATYSALL
jgi:hypothetical protein